MVTILSGHSEGGSPHLPRSKQRLPHRAFPMSPMVSAPHGPGYQATSEKLAQHCVADQWQASRDTAFLPGPLSVEQYDTAIQSGKSLQTSQPDSSISLSCSPHNLIPLHQREQKSTTIITTGLLRQQGDFWLERNCSICGQEKRSVVLCFS